MVGVGANLGQIWAGSIPAALLGHREALTAIFFSTYSEGSVLYLKYHRPNPSPLILLGLPLLLGARK